MTVKTASLTVNRQLPIYISRRTACELLDMSRETFNSAIEQGLLPAPVAGMPHHEPRWNRAQLERYANGDRSAAMPAKERRAPLFVSLRTAAALLDLSVSGFITWVKRGLLPPAAVGSSRGDPRWEWAEIVSFMRGDRSSVARDLLGEAPPVDLGHRRGPPPGNGGRPRGTRNRKPASEDRAS